MPPTPSWLVLPKPKQRQGRRRKRSRSRARTFVCAASAPLRRVQKHIGMAHEEGHLKLQPSPTALHAPTCVGESRCAAVGLFLCRGRHLTKLSRTDIMHPLTLRSGAKMPAVGLGTWKIPREACRATVLEAIRTGYRHMDCACDCERSTFALNPRMTPPLPEDAVQARWTRATEGEPNPGMRVRRRQRGGGGRGHQ